MSSVWQLFFGLLRLFTLEVWCHPVPSQVWQRPQQVRLKYNVDASFSQAGNRTCIGMCVRDDDGAFVLAKTMSFLLYVEFNRQQANEVTHALVGEVALSASLVIYFHIPDCINDIIIKEML
ncbi:hypothetical protein MTR_5g042170 [Medicago truncatula]|uniref:RNase H type-1 domain-containing protein n=1 Tax=Medicago truncatula TaxID=3880 RepID=G7JWG9_MEDTR|nr:hypothetical protein MTR_5g042170 [Medicago truncatula]